MEQKTTGKPAGAAERAMEMPMLASLATISRRATSLPMQPKRQSLRVEKKN